MDDFGDFNCAFPATGVSEAGTNGNTLSNTVESAQKSDDFFSDFSLSTTKAGEFSQPPTDIALSFDAFTSCSLDNGGGDGLPSFADFGQFNMNVADISIPNPDVSNGMFEIPPLPEDLQALSNADMKCVSGVDEDARQPLAGKSTLFPSPELINCTSSSSITHTPSSYQQASLPHTTTHDLTHCSSGGETVSSTTEAGEDTSSNTGSSLTGAVHVPTATHENTAAQDPRDQDDEFGDFESSFNQSRGIGNLGLLQSVGQESSSGEAVTESRTAMQNDGMEFANFASFGAFGGMQSASEGEEWTFGFTDPSISSATQQLDSVTGAQQKESDNNDEWGAFGGTSSNGNGFNAFQSATETISSDLGVSSASGELTLREGNSSFKENSEKEKDSISEFGKQEAAYGDGHESSDAFFGSKPTVNTGTESLAQDDGEFGAFASSSNISEFGNFANFEPSSTQQNTGQEDSEFGSFSSSRDDFGDFSSGPATSTAFSQFSSGQPLPPTSAKTDVVKVCSGVLLVCFSASKGDAESPPPLTLCSLDGHLKSTTTDPQRETKSMWQSVQSSVDFTIPLYKWDKSYMQERYYGALRVDPMLLPRPGALPVFASGLTPLSTPLGSQSAAEDLMESFGFESELEPQEGNVPSGGGSGFRQDSEESFTPALLDLSLPPTPSAESQKESFTLTADLLGLDLNPEKKLTSIEELLINERLVVNRSTWMDSQLLELEDREEGKEVPAAALQSSAGSSSQTSTPTLARKQPSLEQQLLQLGLDASKTSFATVSEQKELSLSSRSLLGRLPDLSFMLADVLVQRTHYQK